MKAKFIVGMVLATTFSFSAMAANKGVIAEGVAKHMEETRKSLFGASASAKGISKDAARSASERLVKELKISDRAADFKEAISSGDQALMEKRLETAAAITSAKISADALLQKGETAEGTSLKDASEAMKKTLINSKMTDTGLKSNLLSSAEMKDVSSALVKLEGMGEAVMKMKSEDRDMYTKVETRRDEILQKGNITGEEALIQSIMDVVKCDKTKALEIARKLKECV